MEATSGPKHKIRMFILILFIMLTLCCVVQSQCDKLTVYNSDTKVNTSSVCLKKYTTNECINFYWSFNQTQLPEDYLRFSDSVERPSFISLSGLDSPYYNVVYPGISITWKSPKSGVSRKSCYGYLVVWFAESTNETKCQLFNMTNGSTVEYRYQFDVDYVTNSTDYTVRVYSMPPSGPNSKEDTDTFVQTRIKTSALYYDGEPGDWSPAVTYQTYNNGTVISSFSLPPANFNITNFIVYLMNKNDKSNPVFQQKYILEKRTEQNTQHVLFLNVTVSGYYQVVVWADDEYSMQPHQCRCWIIINAIPTCKNTCGGTRTDFFYVNVTEPPILVPTTASMTSSTPTAEATSTSAKQTTENQDFTIEHNSTAVPSESSIPVAIIAGVCTAILLGLIIIGVCIWRNKEKVKKHLQHWFSPPTKIEEDPENMIKPGTNIYPHIPTPPVPVLSKKTVYIMSADDHKAHVQLVDSLVVFLKIHCRCNVILPSDNGQRDISAYEWFLNSINRSDHLIFINSKGAEKLIEAYLNRSSYKNRMAGPDGDLFIFGLKHILVSEDIREKTVALVSFHGDHCKKYLQIPKIYMLPKHLPQLLQKIHKLDAGKSYDSVLPMNVDNIPKLYEGAKLLSAIKNIRIYEENNPQWFENTFGELKSPKPPVCERFLSNDSAYPPSLPSDHLDSVSLQLSCSESPTADLQALPYSTPLAQSHKQGAADVSGTKQNEADPNISPHILDDGFSCFTVEEVFATTVKKPVQPHWHYDGRSIIPPETASEFTCDNFSAAVSEINRKNDIHQSGTLPLNNQKRLSLQINENFIIPPESTSQIIFDSHSTVMSEINRNNEALFCFGFEPTPNSKNTDQHLQFAASSKYTDQPAASSENTDQPAASSKNTDQPAASSENTDQPAASSKNTDQPAASNKNHDYQCIEDDDMLPIAVIPPDNPLDINIDSMSTAFADINANSYNMLLQGANHFLLLDENDNLQTEFDSVSI